MTSEILRQVEAEYDLPDTPPKKKQRVDDGVNDSESVCIPNSMSENCISRLRSYLVRFALTTHAGITLDNYWLAQAMETLRRKCTSTAGISASILATSLIPKELVKAEKVLGQAIVNSDFTVIEPGLTIIKYRGDNISKYVCLTIKIDCRKIIKFVNF